MSMDTRNFGSIDLGSSKRISVPMEIIEINLGTGELFDQFGDQFVREARLANPLRAQQVGLTEEEMRDYLHFILYQRVLSVDGKVSNFNRLRNLYMPAFVQYMIAMVGDVTIREMGIKLHPVMDDPKFTYEQAMQISEKVGAFENDLTIVRDAMPRSTDGDREVMNCVLLDGYVRSIEPVNHPVATYVAAILGFNLKKEATFKVLYRVQYDDLAFIESAIGAAHAIYA